MSTLLPPSPLGNEHTTALLPSGNAHAAATSLASASLSARFSAPELPSSLETLEADGAGGGSWRARLRSFSSSASASAAAAAAPASDDAQPTDE